MYGCWIVELWAGRPIAGQIVTEDFVGHWPERDVRGPAELQQIVEETRNMMAHLSFAIEIGPLCDGDFCRRTLCWHGCGPDGPVSFTGKATG
ncbi:MAG: hypothetical protein QOH91_2017 [Mycobacterium sp.]|nr:hypothetical protein [Mycobacterium sp.]